MFDKSEFKDMIRIKRIQDKEFDKFFRDPRVYNFYDSIDDTDFNIDSVFEFIKDIFKEKSYLEDEIILNKLKGMDDGK
jgi:hypothetical protein